MSTIVFGRNLLDSNLSFAAIIIGGMAVMTWFVSFFASIDKLTWMFPLSVLASSITIFSLSRQFNFRQILLFVYTVLWGVRLFVHLVRRIAADKLDRRFDNIRNSAFKRLLFCLGGMVLSYAFIMPQTIVNSILPQYQPRFGVMDVIGIVFWTVGFLMEMVADIQLFNFTHKAENRGMIYNKGLWSHLRHPNYIGEFLQWWGMFMITTPALYKLEWLSILAPIFISVMTLFVSGIPPAERATHDEYLNDPEYHSYLADSGKYIPWFSRSDKDVSNMNRRAVPESASSASTASSRQNEEEMRARRNDAARNKYGQMQQGQTHVGSGIATEN
ncbi:putative FKBP-type peptidyl-prolyl cis-trans isomerase 5 [Monocercomonoides exilis]|uniref:putative FKBP-type peptidyl-prolyl cis-trans isomerase 5 n=1 Tax=Monocercomonoides exilis TaxID=2049356 RepID=UPI003559754C|nr:putative FKBP-type peptidyl-prolyl cis-trans isomerase 5 [Monocercomonoides exilis]|eukprot:MONOS_764.1-p1 / transcript=MONOS_764.1 / gene=MONOS_764 / organism=Monocercomonoides_exilis_PA203 / gene_product=FKBP-type peptidyl-prolyl cis-trans isomerase 5 isoform 1 / transcript_product=FKBP-type peptidyl-prolyl cis-trans isomerase 5 isoform 1 / location=Mono_scaffold00013:36017-37006(-) / protein_length=329 / sequence_SO=supercontig / SO=protein_coding / is_pseudo=false